MTFLSALLGAFFAHFVAKYVDARFLAANQKEAQIDSYVEEICTATDRVRELSFEYFSCSGQDLGKREFVVAAEITGTMHYVNLLVTDLFLHPSAKSHNQAFKNSRDEIRSLMQLTANEDGASSERESQPARLSSIAKEAFALKKGIRSRRHSMKRALFL